MKANRPAQRRAFTLIELLIVIAVIAVLASMAIPSMLSSRRAANEASAISTMRLLMNSQESFRARHNPPVYANLDDLRAAGLIDPVVHSGYKSGYRFTLTLEAGGAGYNVAAAPTEGAGDRQFFLDTSGVIRANWNAPATADSSPIS
jgi:prepilin-type N-terminal cleavage/methylation domain-containing protein